MVDPPPKQCSSPGTVLGQKSKGAALLDRHLFFFFLTIFPPYYIWSLNSNLRGGVHYLEGGTFFGQGALFGRRFCIVGRDGWVLCVGTRNYRVGCCVDELMTAWPDGLISAWQSAE